MPGCAACGPFSIPIGRRYSSCRNGRLFPPNYLHDSWLDYLYWDTELEPSACRIILGLVPRISLPRGDRPPYYSLSVRVEFGSSGQARE